MMDNAAESVPTEIISSQEFQEAWDWVLGLTVQPIPIQGYGYSLDHKHWQSQDCLKCIDQCENADTYLARLYLISQLASVSDYLPDIKFGTFSFALRYHGANLDPDVARVVNAEETKNNLNAFRNSFSEHLAYWVILVSIIKTPGYQDFSIAKPNLQPEDKGPDGLAYVFYNNSDSIIKIISVKNSINSPQELISSSSFRKGSTIKLDEKKILDEFYAFQHHNRGFQRLDDKLNNLLQELHCDSENKLRRALFSNHSQFNASVIADEQHADNNLFIGFNVISGDSDKCIGIYIGSDNWRNLAYRVQAKVKEILSRNGISF